MGARECGHFEGESYYIWMALLGPAFGKAEREARLKKTPYQNVALGIVSVCRQSNRRPFDLLNLFIYASRHTPQTPRGQPSSHFEQI